MIFGKRIFGKFSSGELTFVRFVFIFCFDDDADDSTHETLTHKMQSVSSQVLIFLKIINRKTVTIIIEIETVIVTTKLFLNKVIHNIFQIKDEKMADIIPDFTMNNTKA